MIDEEMGDEPTESEVAVPDGTEAAQPALGAETMASELTSSNVKVGVTGAVSVAATSTAAPTDASTALGTGWTNFGYITEDGVEITPEITNDDMKAWQNSSIVRSNVTEEKWTMKFAVMETNKAAVELYFGHAMETGDDEITVGGNSGTRQSFVADIVDGDQTIRFYVPEGAVTEWEPLTFKSDQAVSWGVTITAYPVGGVQIHTFFAEDLSTTP